MDEDTAGTRVCGRPRGYEEGAGLVSLLLVVSIIAVLAVMAMSASDFQLDMETPEVTAPPAAPGATGRPATPGGEGRRVACESNYRVVETAVATRQAAEGSLALSVEELVAGGWMNASVLSAAPGITLEVVDGVATGAVLVDGRPGLAGCGQ